MEKKITALIYYSLAFFYILLSGKCTSEKHIQYESFHTWVEYVVVNKEFDAIIERIIKNKSKGTAYFSVYFSGDNDSLSISFEEEPSPSRSFVERSVAEVGLNEYIKYDSMFFLLYPPCEDNIQSVNQFKNSFLRKRFSRHKLRTNNEGRAVIESPKTTTIIYRKGIFFNSQSSAVSKADSVLDAE